MPCAADKYARSIRLRVAKAATKRCSACVAGRDADGLTRADCFNAFVEMSSLLRNGGDLNGSVDHCEGRQHWIKVGVDQVSGSAH